jgi:hypothetical protein
LLELRKSIFCPCAFGQSAAFDSGTAAASAKSARQALSAVGLAAGRGFVDLICPAKTLLAII